MPIKELQRAALGSLMAALIAVGAFIHVPIGPVPIVLQNLFVLLAGLLLGARWGAISVGIYLLIGAMGFPVFAGGKGGLAHFMGPTGGYLIGFLAAACITGWVAERSQDRMSRWIAGVVVSSLIVYAIGVPWLKAVTGMPWSKAVMIGMVPFLIGDVFKGAAAIILARSVRPMLAGRLEATSA